MTRSEKEVKIAEKLKFWEEQDQINKELIPRVLKNHEMITDLTYQFEKSLNFIATLETKNDEILQQIEKEIDNLKKQNLNTETKINSANEEIGTFSRLKLVIDNQEQQLQGLEHKMKDVEQKFENLSASLDSKYRLENNQNNNNNLTRFGIVGAIILSFIGIII